MYPAASLMHYAKNDTNIFFIDPNPSMNSNSHLTVIQEKATIGVKKLIKLINNT